MSHLIIEQGKEVGREIEIPPAGMKFGRSPANDLVLDDPAVMLFHGRFFFKSDGSLWVTDFGAGEKTMVGGKPVDEYQLKVGDLVEVGGHAFRVIRTTEGGEDAPAPFTMEPKVSDDEIDLGFKGAKPLRKDRQPTTEAPKNTLMHRLMQVGMVLLVLLVVVIVVPELLKLVKDDTKTVPQKETLAFSYENVTASPENIYRYYLVLGDNGNCSIKINDLKGNRHYEKTKKISETVLLQLANSLDEAGFFQVDSDYAGTAEGQYNLYDIAVQRNRRFHHIKVLNRDPPAEIKRTATVLEDFALSELEVPFSFKWDQEKLEQYAKQSFELGEARYAERDVRYGNLAAAIKHYQEAMLYLETIEPKPKLYADASDGLLRANNERDKRYDDYMFRADRAIRLQDWDEADKNLRILSELIPDRSDVRFEKINSKLLNVEQHLR